MLHPSLSRQFRMNDRNLSYFGIAFSVFSDTMFASKLPRMSNQSQVYAPDLDWTRAFQMASRSEAHETLSLLLA